MSSGFVQPQRRSVRMPMDFTAYLLSANPPGLGFYTGPTQQYNHHHHVFGGVKPTSDTDLLVGRRQMSPIKVTADSMSSDSDSGLSQSFLNYCHVRHRTEADPEPEPEPGSASEDGSTGSRTPHSRPSSPRTAGTSPTSPLWGCGKKRVTFADDLGFALENIRIMYESSETPPRLQPEIFKTLTRGAQAGATVAPPLVLHFPQPASDYLEFRRRIETDCVCLENVILKDYNVLGTIKVKNIAFDKTVLVRCTFDKWNTINDYQASYVANAVGSSQFDTFSFNISVPTNMKTMHFCINYKSENNNFWDSNQGGNYEIATADWKQQSPHFREDSAIFGLGSDQDWSVYSSWANRDASLPYY